jgi:high-affinity Fe2+/Pb2+ permease
MGHAESSGNISCERGLAGPGSPEYQNPLASRQGVQGIALLLLVCCQLVRRRARRDRPLPLTSMWLSASLRLISFSFVCHGL